MDSWVQSALKFILSGTLFLNRLHDFSLLSSNSCLHSFLKSKFTKKQYLTPTAWELSTQSQKHSNLWEHKKFDKKNQRDNIKSRKYRLKLIFLIKMRDLIYFRRFWFTSGVLSIILANIAVRSEIEISFNVAQRGGATRNSAPLPRHLRPYRSSFTRLCSHYKKYTYCENF